MKGLSATTGCGWDEHQSVGGLQFWSLTEQNQVPAWQQLSWETQDAEEPLALCCCQPGPGHSSSCFSLRAAVPVELTSKWYPRASFTGRFAPAPGAAELWRGPSRAPGHGCHLSAEKCHCRARRGSAWSCSEQHFGKSPRSCGGCAPSEGHACLKQRQGVLPDRPRSAASEDSSGPGHPGSCFCRAAEGLR